MAALSKLLQQADDDLAGVRSPVADASAGSACAVAAAEKHKVDGSMLAHIAEVRRPLPPSGQALGFKRSRNNHGLQDSIEVEVGRSTAAMGHLTDELDGLLAEMGRQLFVTRAGHRCELRLAAGATRVVEVKLPKVLPGSGNSIIHLECTMNRRFHTSDKIGLRQGLLPEEPFDVGVADSDRQASDGSYRTQSTGSTAHHLHFATDCASIFVALTARHACHIEFFCRAHSDHGGALPGGVVSVTKTETDSSASDGGGGPGGLQGNSTGSTTGVGRRLQCKLRQRRLERPSLPETLPSSGKGFAADSGGGAALSSTAGPAGVGSAAGLSTSWASPKNGGRPRSFGEYIFGEGSQGASRDDLQLIEAARRALRVWLGPCNRFFGRARRAQGRWVHKLSADCPRKLIRWLRKAEQDRHALTCVAVVGVTAFMLRRWREVHIARARMAMRQLVWYKALFAASRFRFTMVFLAEGRENAKLERRRALQCGAGVAKEVSMQSMPSRRSSRASEASEVSLVDFVRKRVRAFGRGPRGGASPRRPQAEEGHDGGGGAPPAPAPASAPAPSAPEPPQAARLLRAEHARLAQKGLAIGFEFTKLQLATQGFITRPREKVSGPGTRPGSERMKKRPSINTRQALLTRELSERIGRTIERGTPPPVIDGLGGGLGCLGGLGGAAPAGAGATMAPSLSTGGAVGGGAVGGVGAEAEIEAAKVCTAMKEANKRMLRITVRPQELPHVVEVCGGSGEQMSTSRFEQYQRLAQQRCAESLLRKQAAQEAMERGPTRDQVRITKRYLLQFLEEPQDLPWLSLLQGLMLVIRGVSHFQVPQERAAFEAKLRSINEARKAALRRPGAFAPLEAAMWSHPVILQLAARLQRATCRGESKTAWKGTLFEGCYGASSDRDIQGSSFYSAVPVGGNSQLVLRRLVDVSGPFSATVHSDSQPTSVELTPCQPLCLSTHTASGVRLRTFGEREDPPTDQVVRQPDPAREVARDTKPKDLRIEHLRQRRRARGVSSCSGGQEMLVLHSDISAQQRYNTWVMRSDVPQTSRSFKEQLLPYFEGLVASPTVTPESSRMLHTYSQWSTSQMPSQASTAGGGGAAANASVSEALPSIGSAAAPGAAAATAAVAAAAAGESPSGSRGAGASASRATTAPATGFEVQILPTSPRPSGSGAGEPTGGATPRVGPPRGVMTMPQTIEEVGKLVAESDALRSILSIDQAEHGGFAHRCPAGWNSGYRVEPMSREELRKNRMLERHGRGSRPGGSGAQTARQ